MTKVRKPAYGPRQLVATIRALQGEYGALRSPPLNCSKIGNIDAEIARRPWKQRWSNYIRIQYPEFLNIRLGDGISLQNMKAELGSDAFASTQKNAEKREGNTEPTRSIMQKAHMKLTREARSWLDMRFEHTAQRQGIVDTSRPRFAAPSDA